MSKRNSSKTKRISISRKKGNQATNEEDTAITMMVMNANVHIENGTSPQTSHDRRIPDHSTPVQKKVVKNEAEDSPDVDYRCSPIFIPLTQDGNNEVAWDWQDPAAKHVNNVQESNSVDTAATPKRNKKSVQKKRNSDSPLLYKPLKRKLVKLENMDSIGKFAAELQALTEQMGNIKRNDELCEKHECEESDEMQGANSVLLVEVDAKSDEMEHEIDCGMQKNVPVNNDIGKLNGSLEELFDDSINDSMIRCSQEIEEKYIFGSNKENAGLENAHVDIPKEVKPITYTMSTLIVIDCGEGNMNSHVSEHSPVFNVNNCSKTYSKMSIDLSDNSNSSKGKQDSLEQTFFNNNNNNNNNNLGIPNADRHGETLHLEKDNDKLFEIPDDSFDDCLATCMVEETSSTKSPECDVIFKDCGVNNCTNSYKSNPKSTFVLKTPSLLSQSRINGHVSINTKAVDKVANPYNEYSACTENYESVNNANSSNNAVAENRKFFKTKSLSDSCYGQGRKFVPNSKVNTMINSNSDKACEVNVHSSVNSNGASVHEHNNGMSMNGVGNTHVLNVNRFDTRGDGEFIVRYNSLNNLSEGTRMFTPEEIEMKRLEAMTRLASRRKITNGKGLAKG